MLKLPSRLVVASHVLHASKNADVGRTGHEFQKTPFTGKLPRSTVAEFGQCAEICVQKRQHPAGLPRRSGCSRNPTGHVWHRASISMKSTSRIDAGIVMFAFNNRWCKALTAAISGQTGLWKIPNPRDGCRQSRSRPRVPDNMQLPPQASPLLRVPLPVRGRYTNSERN